MSYLLWYDCEENVKKELRKGKNTMITYGSIYLIAKDFEKSISFYRALFQKEVHAQNKTRFAVFDINGLTLAIMNGRFDAAHPDEVSTEGARCALYDDLVSIAEAANGGKVVIISVF